MCRTSARLGTARALTLSPNPNPNPHPHPNPNPNPNPNSNPNPNANVPHLCSARYGTSEDNPAEPSEMNAEGIVRDQGLSFEFRDSNMMKVTHPLTRGLPPPAPVRSRPRGEIAYQRGST